MDAKWKLGLTFVFMTAPALALAQDHGSGGEGGSGGSGCGDVLGDLVHILRDTKTGQPILQKRPVLLPKDIPGIAYCPIPVDKDGNEIGFLPESCDAADPDAVIEVDYFGRLSGGRTKERNGRMHFDEVISTIKDEAVGWVGEDDTGRLLFGYGCDALGQREACTEFATIDSPMENMALYQRLMKYGHLQTDPLEEDTWAHGDPAAGKQYHPALGEQEWRKFDPGVRNLLPGNPGADVDIETAIAACFSADPFGCAKGESLQKNDFFQAASYLAGAANKTGKITVDLVQYMNRILKITLTTEMSTATVDSLPARIRDCGADNVLGNPAVNGNCTVSDAEAGLPAPANERFMKFAKANYVRGGRYNDRMVSVLQDEGGLWNENDVDLSDWLNFADSLESSGALKDVKGFVQAASDGLRAIEFVHNYATPDDLWTLYGAAED